MRGIILCTAVLIFGCGPERRRGPGGDDGSCTDGQMQCDGNVLQTCSGGSISDMMTCPDVCDATLGCVLCSPGTASCNGNTATVCNDSGTGFTDVSCDPVQGMSCDANAGGCTGACS